jgi:hypothetical protein
MSYDITYGSKTYLTVNDNNNNILNKVYIRGVENIFALEKFILYCQNKYPFEYVDPIYCILQDKIIRDIELELKTIRRGLSAKGYYSTTQTLQWINSQRDEFKNRDIHFILHKK